MPHLLLTLVAVFTLSPLIAAQTKGKAALSPDEEIARLRAALSIPLERAIIFADSKELPENNPLRVYGLAIKSLKMGEPLQVTQAWVENWNEKNASKYGPLTAAANVSQADLIFLWLINSTIDTPAVVSELGRNPIIVITSYLIVQKPTGLEVVWKLKGIGADYKFSEAADREFMKRIKARAKVPKK
jgi:hypothetical protein